MHLNSESCPNEWLSACKSRRQQQQQRQRHCDLSERSLLCAFYERTNEWMDEWMATSIALQSVLLSVRPSVRLNFFSLSLGPWRKTNFSISSLARAFLEQRLSTCYVISLTLCLSDWAIFYSRRLQVMWLLLSNNNYNNNNRDRTTPQHLENNLY